MRFLALATDYDGTLAHHGHVDEPTLEALRRLKESGRFLILVTGRELPELLDILPEIGLFDEVVAENGALLYRPADRSEVLLAEPPPASFVESLRSRGVQRISIGRSIVATWRPHEVEVLEAIRDLGLELQVIFNKDAVMVLPSGVNKASGLDAALARLGLSRHNVAGIGDAENDHAFLAHCQCAVAVDNALDSLKHRVDWVTSGDHGRGVVELIDRMTADDLASLQPALIRHHLVLGQRHDGRDFLVPPLGVNILVAGTSGGGKTTLTSSWIERLVEAGLQFALVDPEGDHEGFEPAVGLGEIKAPPTIDQAVELLTPSAEVCAVLNLLGIPLAERPGFGNALLARIQQLRSTRGRPHWLIVDEAHHLFPAAYHPAPLTLPRDVDGLLAITVKPSTLARDLLENVDLLLAVGEDPSTTIEDFCEATQRPVPRMSGETLQRGETLAWWTAGDKGPPAVVVTTPPTRLHQRHKRKYAEGNLGPERSFYFRGPDGALNLRAHNLLLFAQLADGVDDATWLHHLHDGGYERWLRDEVKDGELADEARQIAEQCADDPAEGRRRMRAAIEARYTLPAEPEASVTDPTKFG